MRAPTLLLLPLVLWPRAALPCSFLPPLKVPQLTERVFSAMPLLYVDDPSAVLERTDDGSHLEIPLVADPHPELPLPLEVTTVRPANPTEPGTYQLGFDQFTIQAGPVGAQPSRDVHAIPDVTHAHDARLSFHSSGACGPISSFSIQFDPDDAGQSYVVVATTDDGRVDRSIHGTYNEALYNLGFEAFDFRETRFCVQLHGLAFDGTLGPAHDIGCFDPNDSSDPRVSQEGFFDCSTTGTPDAGALWILALAYAARRSRGVHR